MKPAARIKTHRDQGLYRDVGFLLLAVGFLLVKAFDTPLPEAVVYAPLIVGGAFATLLGGAYALLVVLRVIEAVAIRLGMARGPRR